MKILIVDGYKKADFLITEILEDKHDITFLHEEESFAMKILNKHNVNAYYGDATLPRTFNNMDDKSYDVIIVISNCDHRNFVICQLANKLLDVKKIITLVSNPTNKELFSKMGITGVISASHLISGIIKQLATLNENMNFIGLNKDYTVHPYEIVIKEGYSSINKYIKDIHFTTNCVICCVLRGKKSIIPNGMLKIEQDDHLVIFTDTKDNESIIKVLK